MDTGSLVLDTGSLVLDTGSLACPKSRPESRRLCRVIDNISSEIARANKSRNSGKIFLGEIWVLIEIAARTSETSAIESSENIGQRIKVLSDVDEGSVRHFFEDSQSMKAISKYV